MIRKYLPVFITVRQNSHVRGSVRRWYRDVGIVSLSSDGCKEKDREWSITVDGRRVVGTGGDKLVAKGEGLARALAAEWDAQTQQVTRADMHLSLACENATACEGPVKEAAENAIVDFLRTDTLLYENEEGDNEQWTEIREWFSKQFGPVRLAEDLETPPLAPETEKAVRGYLRSLPAGAVSGLLGAAAAVHSCMVAAALAAGRLGAGEAARVATAEAEGQARRWGRTRHHDLHLHDTRARLAAHALVYRAYTHSA